jgi:O-antigen/teichoic acid export membrane protein
MRIGQTSIVNFLSEIAATGLGFFATLYVARALGSQGDDVLGVYFVIIAVVIWLRVIGNLGLQTAVKKRLSEGVEQGKYLVAGLLLQGALFLVLAVAMLAVEPLISGYLRGVSVIVVAGLLFATGAFKFVAAVLDGLDLVHVSSVLTPLERTVRSLVQIGAVFLGFALIGLFAGYAAGVVVAALAGTLYVSPSVRLPSREHLADLLSYARYAWLTSLSGRAFASADTLVLGLFVADGLIGVYEVSWNLASMLAVFGAAIARSMFPAISKLSSEARREEVAGLVTNSVRFAGLLLVPGLVGAAILQGEVLRIYGPEFTRGGLVLVVLVAARLVYVYQQQFVNALNAIDRPDLAFNVHGLFVVANLALNVSLVALYGWVGAAVATATSALVGLVAGYTAIRSVLPVEMPVAELGRQAGAAVVMGAVVLIGKTVLPRTLPVALGLVALGATVYGLVIFGISPALRSVIRDNLPRIGSP